MLIRFISVLAALLLVGCNSAGPHFRGLPATRITVDGSVFDVRVRGALAEAIRVNPQYAPRFAPIRDRAAVAMAQVSGCDVREVRGGSGVDDGVVVLRVLGPKTQYLVDKTAMTPLFGGL